MRTTWDGDAEVGGRALPSAPMVSVQPGPGATARVHSIESCGLFDGPGVRMVVFLQGCLMRCRYCHNPDTWEVRGGTLMEAEALVAQARRFRPFLKRGGGITVGGGEPMLQRPFLSHFFTKLQAEGFHTCLDTNGYAPDDALTREVLARTNLVILDLKALPEDYPAVTGLPPNRTFGFLDLLTELNIPTWIRHVVVPGLTGSAATTAGLAQRLVGRQNIERIELLPYHRMGVAKYQQLGLRDPLPGVEPPDATYLAAAAAPFLAAGLPLRS